MKLETTMKSDEQGLLGQQQVSQAEHSAISEGPEASDDAKRNTATSQKKDRGEPAMP
jgi:hypothetical protein